MIVGVIVDTPHYQLSPAPKGALGDSGTDVLSTDSAADSEPQSLDVSTRFPDHGHAGLGGL